MNSKQLLDKTLDAMLEAAAPDAEDKTVEEILSQLNLDERVDFSDGHNRKMQELFRKERGKLSFEKLLRYSKRTAAVFLMVLTVFGLSIMSVSAWRTRFFNFMIEMNESYSRVGFVENTSENNYISDEISLEYIPSGYSLDQRESINDYIMLIFTDGEDYFNFSRNSIDTKMLLDTENAETKMITIGNKEAFYSSNSNVNILVWHDDDFVYSIIGTVSEDEMVLIAEKIK